MDTISAVYENGVFRPTGPVELPEKCQVELIAKMVENPDNLPGNTNRDEDQSALWEILNRRFKSGQHDVAERHNEHQS